MIKNFLTSIYASAIVGCALIFGQGCGSAGGKVVDDPDLGPTLEGEPVDIGVSTQSLTSSFTIPVVSGKNFALGVAQLNGVPGAQAHFESSAPPNQVYNEPYTVSWSLRFTGFAGADLTEIQNDATNAESVITSNIGLTYSYFHTTGNAKIKVQNLADDLLAGGSIDKFVAVQCTPGNLLTENVLPINGIYREISTANDACTISIRLDKIRRLVSGTTPQDRVIKHGIDWALAGIGGLGESTNTNAAINNPSTDITNRMLNLNATKATLPSGQKCLANNWTNPGSLTFCAGLSCSSTVCDDFAGY